MSRKAWLLSLRIQRRFCPLACLHICKVPLPNGVFWAVAHQTLGEAGGDSPCGPAMTRVDTEVSSSVSILASLLSFTSDDI